MKPVVITDPNLNISAIVDTESFTGWGPAMPGPDGAKLLGDWLGTLPEDPQGLTTDGAAGWFVDWVSETGQLPVVDLPDATTALQTPPEGSTDVQVKLAEQEAQNAPDVPPPAPADADPTAQAGPTPAEPSASTPAEPTADAGDGNGSSEPAPTTADASPPADAAPSTAPAPASGPCPACNGTGALTWQDDDGTHSNPCGICQGTGTVTTQPPTDQ